MHLIVVFTIAWLEARYRLGLPWAVSPLTHHCQDGEGAQYVDTALLADERAVFARTAARDDSNPVVQPRQPG